MDINEVTKTMVDCAYPIHEEIGPGIFESVYESVLADMIKSVDHLARVHKMQVMTYLKLSGLPIGLLINFGGERLKGNGERLAGPGARDLKQKS